MKTIFLATLILFLFSSCKTIRGLRELGREEAKTYQYEGFNKQIEFLPMHHVGKKEFYADVKKIVSDKKDQGYTIYYELISTDFTNDSLLKDTIRRKVRKIKGFNGSYKENADGAFFEKYVQQPAYSELGTDSSDLRADLNYLDIITEWEKQNGFIELDSMDLYTSFTDKFEKSLFYTRKEYNRIFIEYRNQHLINLIKNSSDQKILVLYGEGHRRDFKKRIK